MWKVKSLSALAAIGTVLPCCPRAAGAVLFPASFTPSNLGNAPGPSPGYYHEDGQLTGGHQYAVDRLTSGLPNPQADVQMACTDYAIPKQTADVTYGFQATGPAGHLVRVSIYSAGSVQTSGFGAGFAYAHLFNTSLGYADGTSVTAWNTVTTLDIAPNTEYDIYLHAEAYLNGGTTGEVQALADPTIVIDPTDPNASQYVIEYSANLPEPGLVSLLPCAIVAGVSRRRRA